MYADYENVGNKCFSYTYISLNCQLKTSLSTGTYITDLYNNFRDTIKL